MVWASCPDNQESVKGTLERPNYVPELMRKERSKERGQGLFRDGDPGQSLGETQKPAILSAGKQHYRHRRRLLWTLYSHYGSQQIKVLPYGKYIDISGELTLVCVCVCIHVGTHVCAVVHTKGCMNMKSRVQSWVLLYQPPSTLNVWPGNRQLDEAGRSVSPRDPGVCLPRHEVMSIHHCAPLFTVCFGD